MILDLDLDSAGHLLFPGSLLSAPKCISERPVCGLVVSCLFLALPSYADAPDYPPPGIYEIDAAGSELRVLVYPSGVLKGLGHSHVISTTDIDGRITIGLTPAASSVQLRFPVESFEVDNDALRAEEGEDFEKKVSEKDKRGTRKNMLGRRLLDSARFPAVIVRSTEWSGSLPEILVTADFTVKDRTNAVEFPISVVVSEHQIVVDGNVSMTHRQLGLKPYRAALGSLRVRDGMQMKFRLTAVRSTE